MNAVDLDKGDIITNEYVIMILYYCLGNSDVGRYSQPFYIN